MIKLLRNSFTIIKKLIYTAFLFPIAILITIITYSGAGFGLIYYLWLKPELIPELWHQIKIGIKEKKLFVDKQFYIWFLLGLTLVILSYIYGK